MNKTILWIIGGLVALGLIVGLAFSIANEESLDESIAFGEITVEGANLPFLEDPSADPAVGAGAPTVSGGDWDDNQYSIAADGRPKIVIFLAHWCPHCQVEVPVVQDWINSGGLPSDVDMYSITVLSEKLRPNWPSQDWLEDEGWTVPVIMDDAQSSAVLAYGMRGTPFYVVLDGENTNLGRFSGEVGVGGLEAMVQIAQASN